MDGLWWETPIKMDDLGGTIIFGNTHKGIETYILWETLQLKICRKKTVCFIPSKKKNNTKQWVPLLE